jgi:hypothetical protein
MKEKVKSLNQFLLPRRARTIPGYFFDSCPFAFLTWVSRTRARFSPLQHPNHSYVASFPTFTLKELL